MSENNLNDNVKYTGEGQLLSDISSDNPLKLSKEKIEKKQSVKKTKPVKEEIKKNESSTTVKEEIKKEKPKKESVKKEISNEPTEKIFLIEEQIDNKKIFRQMATEGSFILKYKGTVIYDSDTSKGLLDFQNDHFILNGKIFSYNGLNFKFKKK